jgi:DNA-binding CsgD family transcriptional regulator
MSSAHVALGLEQTHALKTWDSRPRNDPGERPTILDQTAEIDLLQQRALERISLTEVLNHLSVAVIIVDQNQRIVLSNTAAAELLALGNILSSVHGVLTAIDSRNQPKLRRAIRAPEQDAKSLRFETDDKRVTVATVLPLSNSPRAVSKELHAAIFVHSRPSFDEGLASALATTFGLTAAEGRVLSALLEGLSLSDIAMRYQISINTVRSQLQRLFEKTDTRRQSDLIRIASAAIPPIRNTGREDEALNGIRYSLLPISSSQGNTMMSNPAKKITPKIRPNNQNSPFPM